MKVTYEYYRAPQADAPTETLPYYKGYTAWRPHLKGGLTIASIRIADGVRVQAMARCRPNEQFSYEVGRRIASARLYDALHNMGGVDLHQIEWPRPKGLTYPETYKEAMSRIFGGQHATDAR